MRDTTLPLQDRVAANAPWVSSYFEAVPSLDAVTPQTLSSRRQAHLVPDHADSATTPTMSRMTPVELDAVLDRDVLARSGVKMLMMRKDVVRANVRRAFEEPPEGLRDVKVVLLWCDRSMHDCVYGAKVLMDLVAQAVPGLRKIVVEKIEGANHFVSCELVFAPSGQLIGV